ncbi:hypothetical protein [Flavobacterium gawalongense]|uniref:DUF481 domain-containing protein n=1 Tax=Flavobacterium gawalongense TaxID=2594432 RepID=A0A553BWF4_9FLAO|nr:hypothetical protein [Flavobacterium gawalongense]TRX12549.1 hypothetical protein FNW11_03165 [Flavobacterium gawalongense]TRX12630.1 hypothetical protein FNW10_03490 [Flavobacterium gawalongense]TRX30581.1 hypothetical protein FNW38_04255 [Flavobacterium gawalongense]
MIHIKKTVFRGLLLTLVLIKTSVLFSQQLDSPKNDLKFKGAISVTNNGISIIPTFTLGKPAAIVNLSVGTSRLTFEPELRFSLEGKPWAFIFWGRYKAYKSDKFSLNIGAHPAFAFKTIPLTKDGVTSDYIVSQRYVATEVVPTYHISKDLTLGMYYLYSHGFDLGTIKNTHFVTVNTGISNIEVSNSLRMKISPQVYYLRMNDADGFYTSTMFTVSKVDNPISVSVFFNKVIDTNIAASKDFVWNATLTYAF